MNPHARVRVAHVITRLCQGGAQENTFHTVRLADTARYEVDLISGPTDGPEGTIEPMITAARVPIQREPWLVRSPAPLRDYLTLRRLHARFRQRRYDVIHTHTSKAGILGRVAARWAETPAIIHTPHGNVFHGYFSPAAARFYIALERYAARFTDRIIELTAGGIEEHLERGIGTRAQFRAVFSGIDLSPYDAARARREATRAELGIAPTELLIGGVGRLEPIKGFSYFVEAALRIAEADSRARFVLVGDGGDARALRERAAPLGERFHFLGLRNDVPALFAAMDLALVPSINEGMGRVILEAGAAGVPVVASRAGGIPDVVEEGGTGLLVPARDAAALAEAALALLRDSERRRVFGAAARAKVVPHYSLESMVVRIEAIYEEVLHEKARNNRR